MIFYKNKDNNVKKCLYKMVIIKVDNKIYSYQTIIITLIILKYLSLYF